jgi:hypothetical protein
MSTLFVGRPKARKDRKQDQTNQCDRDAVGVKQFKPWLAEKYYSADHEGHRKRNDDFDVKIKK